MRALSSVLLSVFIAASAGADPAPAGQILSVDPASSQLTFHMVHKLHKFSGVSKHLEGKARLLPGQAQVMIRAPVESFDTGNSNRDAHMKEVVEAARFADVELKAVATDLPAQVMASYPVTVDKSFQGELTFHGVKRPIQVPVKITFEGPDRVHAVSHFAISLDEYKIERPSLLFVKVDDALEIDADVVMKK